MAALDGVIPAIIGAANTAGAGGYEIERSVRFNDDDGAKLTRTFSAGNQSKWTWSGWVKRSSGGSKHHLFAVYTSSDNSGYFRFAFNDDNTLFVGLWTSSILTSEAIFRDFSAWMHIVLVLDTANSTAADRIILYVNGVRQSVTGSAGSYGSYAINSAALHNIGSQTGTSQHFDGYMAEVHFVDGQALAPTDFGEYDDNNVWQPKEYTYSTPKWVGDWASDTTGTPYSAGTSADNAFDENSSTQAAPTTSSSMVFTPSSPITGITKVRIRGQRDSGTSADILLNGSSIKSSWSDGENAKKEFTVTNLTSLEWQTDGSNLWISVRSIEIEVDGVYHYLVLGGVNDFYLKFADNSSNAALGTDSSGNNNTWTVNNIEASGAFGIGTACSILTTSQTITFPITYATTVTYEFFTRVTTAATYTYFAHDTTSADQWNLGIGSGGSLLFGNYNGGWTTFSSTSLNDGNWHFVRLTTTGSSTSLYIDGTLFGTNASGGSVSTGSEITNRLDGGAFRIAYLRITNGGTPPTTGIPALADMNQPAGSGGTLAFFDKLDDIASSGTKTSDGGNVTITMSAATVATDTSGTDSLIDSPTNYTADSGNNGGNYCSLNPLINPSSGQTLKNGNLTCSGVSGRVAGTVYANTGKVYWEFVAGSDYTMSGIESSTCLWGATYPGENDQQYALYGNAGSGQLYHNGSVTSVDGFVSGDVIGVALDLDGGNLYFYKNGAAMNGGSAVATGLTGSWTANCRSGSGGYDGDTKFNFGSRPFAYTPPTGYVSLCTTNLADPTISDGTTACDTLLWSGNDSQRDITGLSFSPSMTWIKQRSGTANHSLMDVVRGATQNLVPNDTQGEGTEAQFLNAFLTDGFSIGTSSTVNDGSSTYVAWSWDAGATTSTNNDGSTQSSVRVSTTNGFSIGTWTGAGANTTVGHGLGAVPGMVIIKKRNGTSPWYVWHQDLGGGGWNLQLNNANARTNNSDVFSQGGSFTSSVIPLGAVGNVSGNNVFFAWSPVEGYSAFGQYTGSGTSDGPFVYTGFRVAWLMIKNRQTSNETWTLHDSTRDVDNPAEHRLLPSSNDAESTGTSARYKDLLSNGFKIRGTSGEQNTAGEIYIYAAFAENPFKTSRAR